MKDIDDVLRRHQAVQPGRRLSNDFTNAVIAGIEFEPRPRARFARLREYSVQITRLPKYAVFGLAILAAGTLSTGAYAAYQWITPSVTVKHITAKNDDNKREYNINTQCDGSLDSHTYKYELQQSSTLTDDQVYKVFKNTCDFTAIKNFADNHWRSDNSYDDVAAKKPGDNVTIYEDSSVFAGATDSNKVFGLMFGKVIALSNTRVTISTTIDELASVKSNFQYIPEGKPITKTWPILPGMQIWQDGRQLASGSVKVGDTVQLVEKTVQPLDAHKHLGSLSEWGITAMIKNTVNPQYVSDETIGNPAIIGQLAGLETCQNNTDYLCPMPMNQRMGVVYSPMPDINGGKDAHYQRKDITPTDAKNAHRIDGRILKIDGPHVTLQTRGTTRTFTADLPYDAISSYNKTNKPTVNVGDLIEVDYLQKPTENHLEIASGDIVVFAVIQHADASGNVHNY